MENLTFKFYVSGAEILKGFCILQKTVIAVLDSLISPDWPNMPENEQDTYLNEWHRVPDIPVRYHFYYQVLDGDNYGRGPFDQSFNHRDLSCLQAICLSGHNKVSLQDVKF